jgi:hypothetical protein
MTPTTAIYLHQSSNSSGSWVEERMNVEVYQSNCGRALRDYGTLFYVFSKKVELVILILQSTGREEINIAFVTINSESLLRCGTNNMTLSAGWVAILYSMGSMLMQQTDLLDHSYYLRDYKILK